MTAYLAQQHNQQVSSLMAVSITPYTTHMQKRFHLCVIAVMALQHKVRDVKYSRDIHKLASLGADGTVKLWDPTLNIVNSVRVQHDCCTKQCQAD